MLPLPPRSALWLPLLLAATGCSPSIPSRFVLERGIGDWSYRRYQRVLDVEVVIAGNAAVGHTATYVRRPAGREREIPFSNVFVSVYERPTGLAAEVRRRVRALASYEVSVRDLGGGRLWYLDAGRGDRWALWVSGARVVKIGASDAVEDVPEAIVSEYMSIYPSDLDEHGRARDGAPSAGEVSEPAPGADTPEHDGEAVPDVLRESAPR